MTKHGKFNGLPSSRQRGQAALFMLLGLGLFLLGGVGLAVDMSNLWMHRQASQNAADAACTAAAMDLVNDGGGATNSGGFTPGTSFHCSAANSSYAPCQYASFNGYGASALSAGSPSTDVFVDNTSGVTVTGVPICSSTTTTGICSDTAAFATPFVRVTVTDRMQTFLIGLLSGGKTMDVGATASCGAVLSNAPIPILVLDPRNETSVDFNGTGTIKIVGGPQRSIQVDANSTSAIVLSGGGNGHIDLTQGGPNNGSDLGVTGNTSQVSNFVTNSPPGQWIDPTQPISDPFAALPYPTTVPPAPVRPTDLTAAQCPSIPCSVPQGTHGCQDPSGCFLYTGGHYTTDIVSFKKVLIFDPGLYYMDGNLIADQQSCLRPATGAGDGSGGTLFYFNGLHTVNVSANAGSYSICNQSSGVLIPLSQLRCITSGTGTTVLPGNVVAQNGLFGNVLLGPCTAPTSGGTNYGDPLGANDPLGEQRGMLFFQDRSSDLAGAGIQPQWGGGGAFGLTGIMYFHYCKSANGAHLGSNCDASLGYTDQFKLQGGSCSSTFVIGDVITDKLKLGGTPCIEMDLNPNSLYYVLKASLLQ